MIKLFNYDNYKLTLNTPELLLIEEFCVVLDKDKTADKSKAFKVFQYVFLTEDWSSPYADYGEKEKIKQAKEDAGLTDKDIEKIEVIECKLKYRELLDSNLLLKTIRTIKGSITEFLRYFEVVNFEEKVMSGPKMGSLLYSVKEYMDALNRTRELMDTIKDLEKRAKEELKQDQAGIRGDSFIGHDKY